MGLLRRGPGRLIGLMAGALLMGIAIGVTVSGDNGWGLGVALLALLAAVGGARAAFRPERRLPRVPAPELVVESDGPIPVGVDGESLVLEPPLSGLKQLFRISFGK
jgi:uncharacterized protein (DUF58 family)